MASCKRDGVCVTNTDQKDVKVLHVDDVVVWSVEVHIIGVRNDATLAVVAEMVARSQNQRHLQQ